MNVAAPLDRARVPVGRNAVVHFFTVPNRGLGTIAARDWRVELRVESQSQDATSTITLNLRPECARELLKALTGVTRAAEQKNLVSA